MIQDTATLAQATVAAAAHDEDTAATILPRATSATTAAAAGNPRPPHILLLVFDDLGHNDLGSFSGGRFAPRTPFMDELMAGGITLTQHYVQSLCSPTRGALMTGRYPPRWRGQSAALTLHANWVTEGEAFLVCAQTPGA